LLSDETGFAFESGFCLSRLSSYFRLCRSEFIGGSLLCFGYDPIALLDRGGALLLQESKALGSSVPYARLVVCHSILVLARGGTGFGPRSPGKGFPHIQYVPNGFEQNAVQQEYESDE
jgi:hypothetical protein